MARFLLRLWFQRAVLAWNGRESALFSRRMREFYFTFACCCLVLSAFSSRSRADDRPAKAAEIPITPTQSSAAEAAIKRFRVAPGLKVDVFASEPLIANPVSFAFDERGRMYVVETHRRRTSV